MTVRRARCIYCDHGYASERPSQWDTLLHLHDCMPLARDAKPGLFHEAMDVAIKLQTELDQERQARQAAAAARDRYRAALQEIQAINRRQSMYADQFMASAAHRALAEAPEDSGPGGPR